MSQKLQPHGGSYIIRGNGVDDLEDVQLNNLILAYKNGDEDALEPICKQFLPLLTSMSERVWFKVKNNAHLECRCLLKLKRALHNFDPDKGEARSLITNVIVNERSEYVKGKRGKHRETYSFEELSKTDDKGNKTEFDVKDVLANVEDDVIETISADEKTALLAKGDQKKLAVLNAWKQGFYNDSELSGMLAHSFGGKKESYRKFIQRFRVECQTILSQDV